MNINDVINDTKDFKDLSNEMSDAMDNVSRETSNSGLSFLKVPSLDKPIEDYLNHPFNKESDMDLAQGLRGIEAYMGNTNLAIMDLFGLVKYILKKLPKKKNEEEVNADA